MDSATRSAPEKKSLHASQRDTEANRLQRTQFVERLRPIPPEKLIFVDESGVTKLKQLLRSAKARTKEELERALTEKLKFIATDDAKAWFRLPFKAV